MYHQREDFSQQWGDTMEVIPGVHEMLAYLLNYKNQMSEWEQNFVSNMTYWLKVRKREPGQVQLMMLSVIYNRLKIVSDAKITNSHSEK